MRGLMLAAAVLSAAGPGSARATDWRAVPVYGRDVGLVDADSVRRLPDGRLSFSALFLLGEDNPSGDYGYDRHSLDAEADCGGKEARLVRSERRFDFRGRAVAAPGWNSEDLDEDGRVLAAELCRGLIGYRALSPQAALAEYREHRSVERLMAYRSDEAELTGTVVQGFEMDGVALCGSEAGCTPGADSEFCWLSGAIEVPVPETPPGAPSETIRRDSADLAFRGRILRSPTGRGFGHMGAFACEVEASGAPRPAAIPPRPPAPERGAIGRTPAAAAAHAALEAAFREIGPVTATQDGRRWAIDELKARPSDWEAACGSDLQSGGRSLEPYPTAIMWGSVDSIALAGPVLDIRTSRWDGTTEFHLGTLDEARQLIALLEPLRSSPLRSVEQNGSRVTLHLTDGRRIELNRADAADAVRLAGIVDSLRGKEIHSIVRDGAKVYAMLVRRVSLAFDDEARAAGIAERLRELSRICRSSGGS